MSTCKDCKHPLHLHRQTGGGQQRCWQFGCRCVVTPEAPAARVVVVVDAHPLRYHYDSTGTVRHLLTECSPATCGLPAADGLAVRAVVDSSKRAEARRTMRALAELLVRLGDRSITSEEAGELAAARAAASDAIDAAVNEVIERSAVTP